MKIYCLDNSELAEIEANHRGYLGDIYVFIDGNYYHLNIYNFARLKQDFEMEIDEYGSYGVEPNLVLVSDISKRSVRDIIDYLRRQQYFDLIKPSTDVNIDQLKEYQ